MKRLFFSAILVLASTIAVMAQNATVIGPITPGDVPQFSSTTIIKDSGIPASSLPTGLASPSGAVGLTAVPGSATTAMRSDAAPPLSASVQSALTGTSNQLLLGTGAFGVSPLGSLGTATTVLHGNASGAPTFGAVNLGTDVTGALPLANGGLGASQSAATANQIPVYPGSAGAAVPTLAATAVNNSCTTTPAQCVALFGYANPVWWGADPTGTSDSASAINSALAASKFVVFPPGKFKILSQISYSFANAQAGLNIGGQGRIVTTLFWPNAAGGLNLTLNNPQNSFSIHDLSLTTGQSAGGTAINLLQNSPLANFDMSTIENVTIRGDSGSTFYWSSGVVTGATSGINMVNLEIYGSGVGASALGNGVDCIGTGGSTGFSIMINIIGGMILQLNNGVLMDNFCQSLTITGGANLVHNNVGLLSPAAASGALTQLTVSNSEFSLNANAIELLNANVAFVYLHDNFFDTVASGFGVQMNGPSQGTVGGNTFACASGADGLAGTFSHFMVSGNYFNACSVGVFLPAGANNNNVQGNLYNGVTTPVSNSGTGNSVGVATN